MQENIPALFSSPNPKEDMAKILEKEKGTETARIRLMVVDDHEVVRRGLVLVLSLESDIELIGEAASGVAAIELAKQLQPDLILMDYKMPGMSGVEAGRIIKETAVRCRILILTGLDSDSTIFDALENGVDGYVLKEITPEKLVQAVRTVARGGAYLDPEVTRKVLNRLNKTPDPNAGANEGMGKAIFTPASVPPTFPVQSPVKSLVSVSFGEDLTILPDQNENLTLRENEIVRNLALGHSNREIAETLIVGEETIRTHLKSIYRKLGVNDRTQAVVAALKLGLINLE